MASPKEVPFSGAIVTASVTWLPRCAVKISDASRTEKSGAMKVAVTTTSERIVTLHELVPAQAIFQPENSDPEAGEALRLTAVPAAKLAVQEAVQLMPAGLLVTVPLPFPFTPSN